MAVVVGLLRPCPTKTSRNENANKHQQSHFAAARLRKGKSSDYGDDDGEDEGNNNIQSAIKVKQMEILCCLMGIPPLMGALFISLCWLVGREFRFYAALVPHPVSGGDCLHLTFCSC